MRVEAVDNVMVVEAMVIVAGTGSCVVVASGVGDANVVTSVVMRRASDRERLGVLHDAVVVGSGHSRAGVGGVVRWTGVVMVVSSSSAGTNSASTKCTEFSVLLNMVLSTTLTEETALVARARGVVVCGRWTVTLLFLVVAGKQDLHEGGDKEDECADNSDREADLLEFACKAKAGFIGHVLVAAATEATAPKSAAAAR